MIDIRLVREDRERIEALLRRRDPGLSLDRLVELDRRRRDLLLQVEQQRSRRNELGRLIGRRKQAGEDAADLLAESQQLKTTLPALEAELRQVEAEWQAELAALPNIPDETVPVSLDKRDNVVVREWGRKREFDFEPKHHLQLSAWHHLFDLERAAKMTGSQWPLYRGLGAQIEWALLNFFLDVNVRERGYTLLLPPLLVNAETLFTAGVLPKFADQVYGAGLVLPTQDGRYECKEEPLYLIPTSEISMTGLHQNEILEESDLPLRYTAYTPCFRREAGTYGAEERGLIRVHQFNKVEMYHITTPEQSNEALESLRRDAEELVERLGLHYRTTLLVTGDLAQQSAKTYDVEVWLPGQRAYYEVSSCSNCTDYQARRGKIRYRRESDGKVEFVHTLNGSGLATSRLLIALLENNQREDGNILIPEALRPYLGGKEVIAG